MRQTSIRIARTAGLAEVRLAVATWSRSGDRDPTIRGRTLPDEVVDASARVAVTDPNSAMRLCVVKQRFLVVAIFLLVVVAVGYLAWWPSESSPAEVGPIAVAEVDSSVGDPELSHGPDRVTTSQAARTEVEATAPNADRPDLDVAVDRSVLRVEVLDALRQPAEGVPLVVAVRAVAQLTGSWRSLARIETDAEGRAEAAGLSTALVDLWKRRVEEAAPIEARLFVLLPIREQPSIAIDIEALPRETLVVTLLPTASVEVTLEHADRTQLEGATVRLRDRDRARDGLEGAGVRRIADSQGRALFEFVGVGLRLHTRANLASGNVGAEMEFVGPVAPGQRVAVRLAMLGDAPFLVAELRDEDNELLSKAWLALKMKAEISGSSSSNSFSAYSDGKGRIVLKVLDKLSAEAKRTLQFELAGQPTRSARVLVPPLNPGQNDLGVLVLRPPPLVCSGTVRGRSGQSLVGAVVGLQAKQVWGSKPDQFHWASVDVPDAKTAIDGAFELLGLVDSREHAVNITCAGYLPLVERAIVVGARGVEFVLEQAATLRGRLRYSGRTPHRRLSVVVHDARSDERVSAEDPSAEGVFEFTDLRPGDVSVRIEAYGFERPVWVSETIGLVAGESVELPDIELDDLLHTLEFTVVDDRRQPVHDAAAVVVSNDPKQAKFEGIYLDAGRGVLLGPAAAVDLLVYGTGYRATRVTTVRTGQEIVLQAAHQLRLHLPAGVELPRGVTLRGELSLEGTARAEIELRGQRRTSTATGGAPPWLEDQSFAFGSAYYVDIQLSSSGRYQLSGALLASGGGPANTIEFGLSSRVVIADGFERQSHELLFTQEAVDRAMAKGR